MQVRLVVGFLLAATAVGCGGHVADGRRQTTGSVTTASAGAARTPLPASAKCPRTPGGRRAKDVGISLGNGPAYPVLGMAEAPPAPGGVAPLYKNERQDGVYLHKTLWAVSPDAPSTVVVRGTSLRTGAPLQFLINDDERVDRLTLRQPDGAWDYWPMATLLPGPGCYAFHVSGSGVNDEIVFSAALA
jgi:hypothetical protein